MTANNDLFGNIRILTPDEIENPELLKQTTQTEEEEENNSAPSPEDFGGSSLKLAEPDSISLVTDDDDEPSNPSIINEPIKSREEVGVEAKKRERIKAFAKELAEEGLLEINDEDFDGTIDSLKKAIETKTTKGIEKFKEEFVNSFSAEKKRFLEIESAFDTETMAMRVASDLEFYNQVSEADIEEDSDVAKGIYARYLTAKGFSQEEIKEEIEEADSLDKLAEKAKRALPALKNGAEQFVARQRAERQYRIQQAQNKHKEDFDNLMNDLDERKAIVGELPYTKHHRDKIKTAISTVVYEDPKTGQRLNELGYKQASNPKEFEVLLQYYNALGLFDTDKEGKFKPNLKTLQKYLTTKATGGFEDTFSGDDDISLKGTDGGSSNSKGDSILSFFEKNWKK